MPEFYMIIAQKNIFPEFCGTCAAVSDTEIDDVE